MNSKERLLTTLKHKIPDRIPWTLVISRYFLNKLEDRLANLDIIGFLSEVGADGINWIGFDSVGRNVKVETFVDGVLVDTLEGGNWISLFYYYLEGLDFYNLKDGNVITREYITPVGKLRAQYIYKAVSNTVFRFEYPIKTIEDCKILAYMVNDIKYSIDFDYINGIIKRVGNEGILAPMLHCTPFYEMIWLYMGLERFHYFFFDYKKEMLNLMYSMAEKYYECYQLYTKEVPVSAIIIPEDASTTLYSPQFFNNYLKPVIKEYVDRIKEGNKIPILHACGHLKELAKYLSQTGIDCVESMSPPPTGNISVRDFKQALPGVCVAGGIPATVFTAGLSEFKEYVKNLIMENKTDGNFILSSGDSVPGDAKIDNIYAIPELIDKYGYY